MARDIGRRCSLGCETWPDLEFYKFCPECGEPTKRFSKVTPLGIVEAQQRVNEIDFEEFYENEHRPEVDPLTEEECAALKIPFSLS